MTEIERNGDSRAFDIDMLEAAIINQVRPIMKDYITDKELILVCRNVHRVLVEDYQNMLKPSIGQTNYMRKLSMKKAVERYGGNCRTCIVYNKFNPYDCMPPDADVMGCSYYEAKRTHKRKEIANAKKA